MSSLVKSGIEFGKGAWGALLGAFAAVSDPLDIAKSIGIVEESTQWAIGAAGMQGFFVGFAFIWMFVWFHRTRSNFEWSQHEPNMPLHIACRYIARDSVWAQLYPNSQDQEWVSLVSREILSKWQLGRFEMFGNPEDFNAPTSFIVPAMKGSAEFNAHNLVSTEPPTHIWSHKHRTPEGHTTVYYRVHLDRKHVERTWPKRSLLSRILHQSPIERIGGYNEIFQEQDDYYIKKNGFSALSLEQIL